MDLCYSCMCTLCLWFGMCWKFLIRTNLFTVNAVTRGGSQYCLGTCLPKWSLGYLLHRLVIHSACSYQHNFNVCQCSCISTVSRLLVAQWKLSQCQAHLNRLCHLKGKKKKLCLLKNQWSMELRNNENSCCTGVCGLLRIYQFSSFCRRQPSKNY